MQGTSRDLPVCERCPVGPLTIYGPTWRASPAPLAARRLAVRHIKARHLILTKGQIADQLYVARQGWALVYTDLAGGRRQVMSFIIPGDALSFESLIFPANPLNHSVKSITPMVLCSFSVDDMRQMMNANPKQREEIERAAAGYFQALNRRIIDLGRRKAHGRIAQLILELEGRMARRHLVQNEGFEFPLRQEHIADATGLTGAHVNRTLSDMRAENLIKLEPRRLQILDRARLVRLAEEE